MKIKTIKSRERFGRLAAIRPTEIRAVDGCVKWECRCDCGAIIFVSSTHLRKGHTQSCGCLQKDHTREANTGERNFDWKGGRFINACGYVRVKCPLHPKADKKGYVYEHRLVMEKKIGRYLRPGEVIHHIDGDPANNAPENLELFLNQGKHVVCHRKLELIAEET